MTRREILGSGQGYEPGGGYEGAFTLRDLIKGVSLCAAYLAAVLLARRLLGEPLADDLFRLGFAAFLAWVGLRLLRDPEAGKPDPGDPPLSPAERRRTRFWALAALAFAAMLAGAAVYNFLAPHPIFAAE